MHTFMTIQFLMSYPDIPTDGKLILKDLPGSGKRIDVLCRCLASGFDWGIADLERIRIEFAVFLKDDITLFFSKPKEEGTRGEVWWARQIQNALQGNPPNFIRVTDKNLREHITDLLQRNYKIFALDEDGEELDEAVDVGSAQYSFMLGNHRGFDKIAQKVIREHQLPSVSLGTRSYLGSHCVATIISKFELSER